QPACALCAKGCSLEGATTGGLPGEPQAALSALYREERLIVRRRGGRKRALGTRTPMIAAQLPNDRWSVGFAADQVIDIRRLPIFVVRARVLRRSPDTLDLRPPGCARARSG